MKKISLLLIIMMLFTSVLAKASGEVNFVVNGSFEDGLAGIGIAYSGKDDTVLPKIFISDKYASDGEKSLEFVANADLEKKSSTSKASNGFAYQGFFANEKFDVLAESEYNISADVCTNKENIKTRFIIMDGSKAVYCSEEISLEPQVWNSMSFSWIPDKNYSDVKIRIAFYDINKGDKIYIDNIRVIPSALTNQMWEAITNENLISDNTKVTFNAESGLFKENAGVVCNVNKNFIPGENCIVSGYISTDLDKAYIKLSCENISGSERYFIVKKNENVLVQIPLDLKECTDDLLKIKLEVFGDAKDLEHTVNMYDFSVMDSNCIIKMEEAGTNKIKSYGVLRNGNENNKIKATMTDIGEFEVNVNSDNEYSFTQPIVFDESEFQKNVMVELKNLKGYSDVGEKISGIYVLNNKSLLERIAVQADGKTTVQDLNALLNGDVLDALGVTVTDVFRSADKTFVMSYLTDKDISDADKLKKEILTAACINVLDKKIIKLTDILDEYSDILDMNSIDAYKDLYKKINKDSLNSVFSLLTTEIGNTSDLQKSTAYAIIKIQLEEESTYSSAMNLINKYSNDVGLNLRDYNNLSGTKKFAVQENIVKYIKKENDYKKVNDSIDEFVKNAASQKPQGGGSSGSSGGGGTSGRGSGVVHTEIVKDNSPEKSEYKFSDIANYGWAEESIYKLLGKGIISESEDNCFYPGRNITRAEFAKMVAVQFGKNYDGNEEIYNDVTKDAWYYTYVMALRDEGIINGVSDSVFAANEYITRQDICVIIARLFGVKDAEIFDSIFDDSDSISEYAKNAVQFMNEKGYINGYDDNTFRPRNFASRAEVAKILGALK